MDLRGTRLDIHARKGSELDVPLTLPVDLTGATVRARVQTTLGALVVAFSVAVTDAPKGRVTLSLARAALDNTDAPPGVLQESASYEWACAYEKGGKAFPAFYGAFLVSGVAAP